METGNWWKLVEIGVRSSFGSEKEARTFFFGRPPAAARRRKGEKKRCTAESQGPSGVMTALDSQRYIFSSSIRNLQSAVFNPLATCPLSLVSYIPSTGARPPR